MPHSILIIDDTVHILEITKHFLQQEGYEVFTASDPYKGIERAKQGGIDLIILDIMMPGLNGYQVFEILKKDSGTVSIPVIMLTARAVIENTPRPFFYGLYGVLSKPFQRWRLVQMVKDIFVLMDQGQTEGEVKEAEKKM
ncbi:MAG: response regulator [Planctomycetes bacterium]|nr:response regulator [Planctomycetota bacterium]